MSILSKIGAAFASEAEAAAHFVENIFGSGVGQNRERVG